MTIVRCCVARLAPFLCVTLGQQPILTFISFASASAFLTFFFQVKVLTGDSLGANRQKDIDFTPTNLGVLTSKHKSCMATG